MTDELLARGRKAGDHCAALDEALRAEQARRDALIVDMRDAGIPWAKIAAAVRLSPSRCAAIVAEDPGPAEITTRETAPA